jgi:(p)ppGpp synthase/HD superfamily hydrolase
MLGIMQNGYSPRFGDALMFADQIHRDQTRKGSGVPYIGHLLGTAALVIDDGGSEDEAIAALLHDAAEDQGGEGMLDRIEQRFGGDVRRIVAASSDTLEMPKPPWRERKERYIASIAHKRPDELRVSLADKVYNVRAILHDYNTVGEQLWERFTASRDEVLWYYRSLTDAFQKAYPGPLADELERTVDQLEASAA